MNHAEPIPTADLEKSQQEVFSIFPCTLFARSRAQLRKFEQSLMPLRSHRLGSH